MKKIKTSTNLVKLEILHQGAMVVNFAYIQANKGVVAIAVDMKSKRGEIYSTGNDEDNVPTIAIEATEDSAYLKRGVAMDEITEISFPEYAGWTVWCAEIAKHTIYVCLIKGESK